MAIGTVAGGDEKPEWVRRIEEILGGLERLTGAPLEESLGGLIRQLGRIEAIVVRLGVATDAAFYTVGEVAIMEGRSKFTVQTWCREGRIEAEKSERMAGPHATWIISREAYLRFKKGQVGTDGANLQDEVAPETRKQMRKPPSKN